MSYSEKKTFVTGGTGMLGAHLIWHLLQKGLNVCAIKRKKSRLNQAELIFKFHNDSLSNYTHQLEWVEGDVLDFDSLDKGLNKIAVVYHCAALVSFGSTPDRLQEINLQGTQNVVYAALKNKVEKFCFVSSIGALGSVKKGKLIDENALWSSKGTYSPYSESKFLSEEVVWDAMKKGLNAVIVNPGVILGAAENTNGTMQLFSTVQKGLPIYTKGGSGYVSVEDVCKAMIALTESNISAQRFVLVSENLSNQELLYMIADGLHKRRPFINGTRFLLMPIGFLMELTGSLLHKKMILDRGTVRVALSRSYYSSEKVKQAIGFEFTPIKSSVNAISSFLVNTKRANG